MAHLIDSRLLAEYECLLHLSAAPKDPQKVQELIGRFQQCLLQMNREVEKQAQKVAEYELMLQQQGFHDPFAQKRDDLRLKEVELIARDERLKQWEHQLMEEQHRITSMQHSHRMEALLFEEQARLKNDASKRIEHELNLRERKLAEDKEALAAHEIDVKRKGEGVDAKLENSYRKALTVEKQKMQEDIELQLAQRSKRLEKDLEVQWSLEADRRVQTETEKIRQQLMQEYDNDLRLYEACKAREMQAKIEELDAKHEEEVRVIKNQYRDLLAEAEKKHVELVVAADRDRKCFEEERRKLAAHNQTALELEKERLDTELQLRLDQERAKTDRAKRDMMELLARQNSRCPGGGIEPGLHEKQLELDRRESEVHNLKAELMEERNTHEAVVTRFRDEVRCLREKLTSKAGMTAALKMFDVNIRNSIIKDSGYSPTSDDVIRALRSMMPSDAAYAVASANIKLSPSEEEILDFVRGLNESQLRRLVKKLHIVFDPTELVSYYRNMSPGQMGRFLTDALDKNAMPGVASFLKKLDPSDQFSILDGADVPYLRRTDDAVRRYLDELHPKRQAAVVRDLQVVKDMLNAATAGCSGDSKDSGPLEPAAFAEMILMPRSKDDLLRVFKDMEVKQVHDAVLEWKKLDLSPEDLKKLVDQRVRPDSWDRFLCLAGLSVAGKETEELVQSLRVAAAARRREISRHHFH